jgi:PAS domain S-box-containing protein
MYRWIVDALPGGVWIVDPQGQTICCNARMAEMLGTHIELLERQSCLRYVFPSDFSEAERLLARNLAGDLRPFDFCLQRTDGSAVWANISCKLMHDEAGAVVGLLGLFRHLEASPVQLKDAQRLANVGSWQRDETGKIHWSDEMHRIYGRADVPADFAAFLDRVHPGDRHKVLDKAARAASSLTPVQAEFRVVRPDGEVRSVRNTVEAVRNGQGAVVRLLGTTQDITEQVRAREVLQESAERLNHAERLVHVGYWHWDIRTNRVTGSEEMFRIFGKPPDFIATPEQFILDIVPEDRERVQREITECFEGKSGYSIEYRIALANGELRTIKGIAEVSRDEEGALVDMFGACQDITDSRRAQEEMVARQKLEGIGTLASGIAHDFNNILGAVMAQADLALAEMAAGAGPEEQLWAIRDISTRGSEIVRELMAYTGKESQVLGPVDLSHTLDGMIKLLEVSISKHAKLQANSGKDVPAVWASGAQLQRIIMNLVTNASEALGGKDGVIRLTTERLTVNANGSWARREGLSAGDYVQLEVSDTGAGISPETQARVFDPFFTTKSAGRGLGLSVTQGIVRSLHGGIQLRSELGKGTTFQVLLPCAGTTPVANNDLIPRVEDANPPQKRTILVAEDENLLRQAVVKLLSSRGFAVIEAGDGTAALQAIQAQHSQIDVLFLDVTIPGTSSREVFEAARRLKPEMKVIVTSAYDEDFAAASLRGSFEHFLRKPYRITDLVDLLRRTHS